MKFKVYIHKTPTYNHWFWQVKAIDNDFIKKSGVCIFKSSAKRAANRAAKKLAKRDAERNAEEIYEIDV